MSPPSLKLKQYRLCHSNAILNGGFSVAMKSNFFVLIINLLSCFNERYVSAFLIVDYHHSPLTLFLDAMGATDSLQGGRGH